MFLPTQSTSLLQTCVDFQAAVQGQGSTFVDQCVREFGSRGVEISAIRILIATCLGAIGLSVVAWFRERKLLKLTQRSH